MRRHVPDICQTAFWNAFRLGKHPATVPRKLVRQNLPARLPVDLFRQAVFRGNIDPAMSLSHGDRISRIFALAVDKRADYLGLAVVEKLRHVA